MNSALYFQQKFISTVGLFLKVMDATESLFDVLCIAGFTDGSVALSSVCY